MICLNSGVEVCGIASSAPTVDDDADPVVRIVFDSSDKRLSGLLSAFKVKGVHSGIRRSKKNDMT